MSNELLYAKQDISFPGGNSTYSVCVLDVSPYSEIRGFFAQRIGEITLALQVLAPNSPGAEPSASNGYVIGMLDQFALEGDFTRTYSTPGIWLEVIATSGPGGGVRIGQLTFVGQTCTPLSDPPLNVLSEEVGFKIPEIGGIEGSS